MKFPVVLVKLLFSLCHSKEEEESEAFVASVIKLVAAEWFHRGECGDLLMESKCKQMFNPTINIHNYNIYFKTWFESQIDWQEVYVVSWCCLSVSISLDIYNPADILTITGSYFRLNVHDINSGALTISKLSWA